MFNPDQFLDMPIDGAMDTKVTPVPLGEYTAVVDSVKVAQWQKKDDPSVAGLKLQIIWNIDDSAVKELLKRDKVTVRQDVMLDLSEDGARLDTSKGRNVGLGRVRAATDLNDPGRAFAFSQLVGRMAKVKIGHRVDGEDIYAEVKGVAKL